MSTAALEERSMVATVPTVRRRVKARPLPRYVSWNYPLFGAKIGVRAILRPQVANAATQWFIEARLNGAKHPWNLLWNICRDKNPNWFSRYWRVRLYDESRALGPGDYIFQPTTNFTHIPGKPADQVEDAYIRALLELGGEEVEFTYLDLLWKNLPTGVQQLLTPKRLEKLCYEQQQNIRSTAEDWMWLYHTQRFCRRRIEAILFAGMSVMEFCTRHGRSVAESVAKRGIQLEAQFRATVLRQKIVSRDPVIVFEDWKSCRREFGGVPLGLVAHWD